MVKYYWHATNIPSNLVIKQVYGVAFSTKGNILLRVDNNKYKLTGGKPENGESFAETLKREFLEELNVEIDDIYYLGYLLVKDNDEEYAQVRMLAKIKNIGENKPDPDNGKIYKRLMASVANVKNYLNYPDDAGNKLIDDAIKLAEEKYQLNSFNDEEYFI